MLRGMWKVDNGAVVRICIATNDRDSLSQRKLSQMAAKRKSLPTRWRDSGQQNTCFDCELNQIGAGLETEHRHDSVFVERDSSWSYI